MNTSNVRIVAFSDTHNQHRQMQVPNGDIVIHAGDACIYGSEEEQLDFVKWFSALPHKHRIFIGGNHDAAIANPKWRSEALKKELHWSSWDGGTLYLEGEVASVIVNQYELRVCGAPWRPRPADWTPLQTGKFGTSAFGVPEDKISEHWSKLPEKIDILITHVPAYGVLDYVIENQVRIGCNELALKLATMAQPPLVHIFGHVHDSYGQKTTSSLRAHNVAICNADQIAVRQPQVINL